MSPSQAQLHDIDVTEKVCSAISLAGAALVIGTFLGCDKFRKPINRLVFYASWGNVATNVATIVGRSGILAGTHTPLCRFQAFFIQWFMLADAIWIFSMAINVYLTFFHHYDAQALRKLEWRYLAICYGVPLVPAFTYLFVNTRDRGPIYGDAVLWCWISLDWDFLRVATFYGPAWVLILCTFVIYIRVGVLIWQKRAQLLSLGKAEEANMTRPVSRTDSKNITKTCEFTVTIEPMLEPNDPTDWASVGGSVRDDVESTSASTDRYAQQKLRRPSHQRRGTAQSAGVNANKSALKYARTAMLFFIALLCTWVPSSINRVYTLAHTRQTPFSTAFAAALVLPLQGVWNAIVYIATSWGAFQALWSSSTDALLPRRPSRMLKSRQSIPQARAIFGSTTSTGRHNESETASLAPWTAPMSLAANGSNATSDSQSSSTSASQPTCRL